MEEKKTKINTSASISNLSIQDLVAYEKGVCSVCLKYENALRQYDGSIAQDTVEYKKFETMNKIHQSILIEMEKRLNELN